MRFKSASSSLFLLAEQCIVVSSAFIFTILATRYLEKNIWGSLVAAQASYSMFSFVATLSMNGVLFNKVSRSKSESTQLINSTTLVQLFSSLILVLILYLFYRLKTNTGFELYILFFGLIVITKRSENIFVYYKNSIEGSVLAMVRLFSRTVGLVSIIVGIYLFEHYIIYFVLFYYLIDPLCSLTLYLYRMIKCGSLFSFSLSYVKEIFEKSKWDIPYNLVVQFALWSPVAMLNYSNGPEAVAIVSIMLLYINSVSVIFSAISDGLYKIVNMEMNINIATPNIDSLFYTISFFLSLFITIIVLIFSNELIPVIFGNKYLESVAFVKYACLITPIVAVSRMYMRKVYMLNINKYNYKRIFAAGLFVLIIVVTNYDNYTIYNAVLSILGFYLISDFIGYFMDQRMRFIVLESLTNLNPKNIRTNARYISSVVLRLYRRS